MSGVSESWDRAEKAKLTVSRLMQLCNRLCETTVAELLASCATLPQLEVKVTVTATTVTVTALPRLYAR